MDYSGYREFPFPSGLSPEEEKIRDYFLSLSDEEQLGLLNGSDSYQIFFSRVRNCMSSRSQ